MPSLRSPLSHLSARLLIAALVFASLPANLLAARQLPPRLLTSLPGPAAASGLVDSLRGPIHADGIGSIRRLTDEAANITDGYTYSAFGELLAHTGSDPQPYAFAGEPLDPNSAFQYHRARWLDPRTGRFASTDPFSGHPYDPRTLHKYVYAGNSPEDLSDASGLDFSVSGLLSGISVGNILRGISSIVPGAVLGALGGAGDAYFGEGNITEGAIKGAIAGALLGPLGRIKALQPFLISAGLALSGTATFQAFLDDDPGLGLYRGIVFVAAATATVTAFTSGSYTGGRVLVYQAKDPASGQVAYVGITQDLAARAATHLRTKGIKIQEISGMRGLSRDEARGVEQALINFYGLGKNGGTLLNKINSIAATNPQYSAMLARGAAILREAGIPGL